MAVFGIDLGTSNSLISFWDGEKVQIVPNQHGEVLTPSVVSIDENGEVLVGAIAKERLITHPMQTAAAFKRFIGTQKKYLLGEKEFSPVELSALILRSLKASAEAYLHEPCEEAIISVPAYFNNIQREATMEAAKLAHLNVKQLISEPTAAAVAYGQQTTDKMILVLDLGGGTFDVSLLDLFDGIMQVEAISGDNYLGGEDFTELIIKDFLQGHPNLALTPTERGVLYRRMEAGKKLLSSNSDFSTVFQFGEEEYLYQQTPAGFQKLSEHLFNRLNLPIMRVLKDGGIKLSDLDQVILVGGATRSDMVRQYFAKILKQFPFSEINPDEVVSIGAAIHGGIKDQTFKEELILTDVSAHSLGVETSQQTATGYIHDIFFPIIERNTTIPVSIQHPFGTLRENQKTIRFGIYQGESPKASENLKIGELTIPLPKGTREDYLVTCRFTYDNNGVLEVVAQDPATGREVTTVIEQNPGKLSEADIQKSLKKFTELKILPQDKAENRLLVARLERWYSESLGDERHFVQQMLLDFDSALMGQNPTTIRNLYRKISKIVEEWEGRSFL
ncbi:Hsp70 family protein [Enterococcus sp. LJL120]